MNFIMDLSSSYWKIHAILHLNDEVNEQTNVAVEHHEEISVKGLQWSLFISPPDQKVNI